MLSLATAAYSVSLQPSSSSETLLTLVALLLGFSSSALERLSGLVDSVSRQRKSATYLRGMTGCLLNSFHLELKGRASFDQVRLN